jgi:1-acyl-sn-glycerol-3-phosphate acyltransferase
MWLRYSILRPIALIVARGKKYRLRYTGTENVPTRGPFIVISNHQTFADPIAVALALHKTAKNTAIIPWGKVEIAEGLEGPLGEFLWWVFKIIPIDREVDDEMARAIRASLDYLRQGKIVMVFPEGSRYPRGELGPFKFGVANLARGAPAPILPVACWRRRDDGGIQVKIGQPFFMPNIRRPLKKLAELGEKADDRFSNRVDVLKQWSEGVTRDPQGHEDDSRHGRPGGPEHREARDRPRYLLQDGRS